MKRLHLTNWFLQFDGKKIPAQVPGDITIDLRNAGLIDDPHYSMNHCDLEWIPKRDFTYETTFTADDTLLKSESVRLFLEGVDLFSEIYLNDHLLGKTENMFLGYDYEVLPFLIPGNNKLRVEMKSTIQAVKNGPDSSKYISLFNQERFFLRKAQCHFGWDWAPNMCGYGIWGKVYLEAGSHHRIRDVHYVSDTEGNVTFFAEVLHFPKSIFTSDNVAALPEHKGYQVRFSISEKPFCSPSLSKKTSVDGSKCLVNFKLHAPELWWPVGYGEQPLYDYKVELLYNDQILDYKTGRFAFRTVKVLETPYGDKQLRHALYVNNTEIFMKGSNWVPLECFTGIITRQQYERFINRAIDANFNILRIWGGGIYEQEDFYELCDEKGLMVWQDLGLACSEVPDDHPDWQQNFLQEVEYQIRRLRVHPSLVYWSGGNERQAVFAPKNKRGNFLINYTLPGFVNFYDNTRPYYRNSPCAYTDNPNDPTNGDCHWGSFERILTGDFEKYRTYIAESIAPLASENAILGPCSVEAFQRFLPPEKQWPMNEIWVDRLTDNPYALFKMNFAEREYTYAKEFYGEPKNLRDFVAKGMQVHAEAIRAELEIMRAHKDFCSGFMNWMYNDIWPEATWAVVDYYGEPKQAYYQMKRSFSPILATFVQEADSLTYLAVINDLPTPYTSDIHYGVKAFSGQILFENTISVTELSASAIKIPVDFDCEKDDLYLFAEYIIDGATYKTLYSPHFWKRITFSSDYTVHTKQITDHEVKINIHANAFAKSIFISHKDNYKFTYSDNYIDLEAGDEAEISVTSTEPFSKDDFVITDFAAETK